MDKILAASFGIAGTRISGALMELYDAYNVMKGAGIKLTADDKEQFDKAVKQVSELANFLNNFEWQNALNAQGDDADGKGDG